MAIHNALIPVLWLIFLGYWGIMAIGAKRSLGRRFWWPEAGLRLGAVVLLVVALRRPGVRSSLRHAAAYTAGTGALAGAAGVALCALGIGLAIWARTCLGRNWGRPMSRKEDPELITSGPYAVIRHPIYTGVVLAVIGSALGESLFWVLPLLLAAPYFIYSARREEKLMMELFPDQYPAYVRRTRMLVPLLF